MDQRKSVATAWSAKYYALAFFATYCFAFVSQMISFITGSALEVWYFLGFLVFLPSAGTFNFWVFARRRSKMQTWEGKLLSGLLCCTLCSVCRYREEKDPVSTIKPIPSAEDDSVGVFVSETQDGKGNLFKGGRNESSVRFGAEQNGDEDAMVVFE